MRKQYRKKDCKFCELAKSYTSFDINDKFYWRYCEEHKVPIIIYKYHSEPTDKEVKEVLEWAKKKFPYLTPVFERKHCPSHYSFEFEPLIKVEKKESLVVCDNCKALVPIEEAIEIAGEWYCALCASTMDIEGLEEASDFELFQIIDEDDYLDW